eukprot:s64_g32.t1
MSTGLSVAIDEQSKPRSAASVTSYALFWALFAQSANLYGAALEIQNSTAQTGGGAFVGGLNVFDSSTLSMSNCSATNGNGGGFNAQGLQVTNGSSVTIEQAKAQKHGGGFFALEKVSVTLGSTLTMWDCVATDGEGGGFNVQGLQVTNGSSITIEQASARKSGGGFLALEQVSVTSGSTLSMSNCTAEDGNGGGFVAFEQVNVDSGSTLSMSNCTAEGGNGGGIFAQKGLQATNSSSISIQHARAGRFGGGWFALAQVSVTSGSTLSMFNCTVVDGNGGGFNAQRLQVTNASRITIEQARAGNFGGCFIAWDHITVTSGSTMTMSNCTANGDGGGFNAQKGLEVSNGSSVTVRAAIAPSSAGIKAIGQVKVMDRSVLKVQQSHGKQSQSTSHAISAECFQLGQESKLLLEGNIARQGLSLERRELLCTQTARCNAFEVAENAVVEAQGGQISDGLVFIHGMAGCPIERLELSRIHASSWIGPLIRAPNHLVVLQDITVRYLYPVEKELIVASHEFMSEQDAVHVTCEACSRGVTFEARDGNLHAVSPSFLNCTHEAVMTRGTTKGATHRSSLTSQCQCDGNQVLDPQFPGQMVRVQDTQRYCTFCSRRTEFANGECRDCPFYKSWSEGREDRCRLWPRDVTILLQLALPASISILLVFVFVEIISAPQFVVDAVFQPSDPSKQAKMTLKGPANLLPKLLGSLVHGNMSYRMSDTGLNFLDGKVVKLSRVAHQTFQLEGICVPFDSATSRGVLVGRPGWRLCFAVFSLWIVLVFPWVIAVAFASEHALLDVAVTLLYCTFPGLVALLLLHPLVVQMMRRHYKKTPLQIACYEYTAKIVHEPPQGPDAYHPRNQGLAVCRLQELTVHFEKILLTRNMHFVVSNIVRPLTHKTQSSFVSLWGGKAVDYFVSHCWQTSFQHFVKSIRHHAVFCNGTEWPNTRYWICSFANNQWQIEAELGESILESPFARALRGGVKGVVMVLDHDVLPLTRVWCLFELLLSGELSLDLTFATDVGIIGDDRCDSVGISLELAKKVGPLQVANCHATSDRDRNHIFTLIISELGSLERMDERIKEYMSKLLILNLSHANKRAADLQNWARLLS